MYTINKNNLTIGNNDVQFGANIYKVLEVDDLLIIILLNMPLSKKQIDNNVYAVNMKGEIIWQIQDPREVYPIKELDLHVGARVDEFKRLAVSTFSGIVYYVNVKSGRIISRNFTK